MNATYKSNDPVEVRQDYDNLAAEIQAAKAQYDELGARINLMQQNHEALSRHLARLTNPNAKL